MAILEQRDSKLVRESGAFSTDSEARNFALCILNCSLLSDRRACARSPIRQAYFGITVAAVLPYRQSPRFADFAQRLPTAPSYYQPRLCRTALPNFHKSSMTSVSENHQPATHERGERERVCVNSADAFGARCRVLTRLKLIPGRAICACR